MIKIDRSSKKSLKAQVIDGIRKLIDEKAIETNTPLLPTRTLAEKIGVSRYTVIQAYEELQVLGYLQSRQGSYHFVKERRKEAEYDPERKSVISWDKAATDSAETLFKTYRRAPAPGPALFDSGDDIVDLSDLQLDPDLFPKAEFRRCIHHVLMGSGERSLDFCRTEGNDDLREYIAQRLRLHGISTSRDEILITYGSQQALDLVIGLLARAEKKVVIEAPTYFNILPLLKFHNVDVLTVPMKSDGMDLNDLEKVLRKEKVSFVYTIPNFHNPTGITTSHPHRERLLSLCLRYKVPILEDGFDEEMKYFGRLPMPIKSIDAMNSVIYVGTFSKILFPGVRIGWITADRSCIERLAAIKRCTDLRCGNLVQTALALFCREGYYDLHIKRLHRIFRKKMEAALASMDKDFPKSTSWLRPSGGYTIWVKMPRKMSAGELTEFLRPYRVTVSPGELYYPRSSSSEYFRLSISRVGEDRIREGIARLGKALQKL
jgi:GntR family transcriptional regulator/MocR family aminotransferase